MFTDISSFINKLLDPSVDTDTVMPSPSPTKEGETYDVKELSVDTDTDTADSDTKEGETYDVKELSVDPSFEEPISDEFISQISNLVKLVDSNDIMELQLKQLDFELLIRKKEAIPIPTSSSPIPIMHQSYQPLPLTAISTLEPSPSNLSLPAALKSSIPPLKSPMAGTFYRSPAPGEPPFVKVGDKVQKGQVICIIEAMKLMNEIEADQSGAIVHIVAEDGKPVSFDTVSNL
ncbi:biotin carboxyl carrier protein of acetyl-CoA carboxylase 1, chloroplastic-like [Impatiens glandulifera]|uniref:biotin carboxyl carrier protein of acetyl-CoA carboxylase 1, chloroplastic-like n=1 Tax=Impatiens glandulifera TaxID=253017 RepID=UPI001FB0BF73|nr:biotin carboxyl carrier protein of acetyl-CoA carboxylase 1, chloroplastic-like [Impatiens glandulifera]